LQYADPSSAAHRYHQELSPPEPMRADVPAGLPHSRVVIACVLDRAGVLRNLHILEPGSAEMDSRILAALPSWKFRPAQRGDQPVEVNAILGFNIDTR
jgi:TonB family protein